MRATLVWRLGLAVLALGLSGCGRSGDDVVARVGKEEITVSQFADFMKNIVFDYPTAQDEFSGTKGFLDSMIVQRLLIQAAYEKGMDKSEEVARLVLANKEKFLLDALFQKEVVDKAAPTEAEMQDFWNKIEYKIRVSQILVREEDTANMIVQRLSRGENFEQLAVAYSADAGARRNRGDLGQVIWGAFLPQMDDMERIVHQMVPGEVSKPIKSEFGHHIMKVTNRALNETRLPYEQMKETLKGMVQDYKQKRILYAYVKEIRKKYPITVDRATVDFIQHKRNDLYPPQLLATLPRNDFDDNQLDRNEKELELARWEGGPITLYEYLTLSRQSWVVPASRPNLDDVDSLASFMFQLKYNDILTYEAVKSGIENDPVFKNKLLVFKEFLMADMLRNDSIPKLPPPDDVALRRYYEEHPEEFTNPAKVHVFEIHVSDELLARKLAKEIKSLPDFKRAAAKYTERPAQRGTDGDLGYVEKKWFPNVFDLAMKSGIGDIVGPVVEHSRYSVIYVADKMNAELKDYLGMKRQILEKLTAKQRTQEFDEWLADRRSGAKIEIFDEAIWKVIDTTKYAAVAATTPQGR